MLSQMYLRLHVQNPLFLSYVKWNLNFLGGFSKKFPNMKFLENPTIGNRVVPCGQTDRQVDGRTDGYEEAKSRFSQFYERA